VIFDQDSFHVVAGMDAVDTREYVDATFRALKEHGQVCARMGAYKPRTSPYSFQGYGKQCLPYVFELAGKHGIRVISMEVTRDEHVDEIRAALAGTGDPCGVMLQIGTRNTQNFELLKAVGSQRDFPILLKRGFGITLHESLLAAEYVASGGNRDIVFCLRGMKTNFGDPHRNLVDFAHVPVVKRLTRMPVCIDPSHSVGTREVAPDGLPDVFHVAAQGIIAGANLVLTDIHPEPAKALVDAGQALTLAELPRFLDDCALVREAYLRRLRPAS
jgi:3-deoxy-7-phosphoheptulonate synthase